MDDKVEISINKTIHDATSAVAYHIGKFPPSKLNLEHLIGPLTDAVMALVRYDTEFRQWSLNTDV